MENKIQLCEECGMVAVYDDPTGIESDTRTEKIIESVRSIGWITMDGVSHDATFTCDCCGERTHGSIWHFFTVAQLRKGA